MAGRILPQEVDLHLIQLDPGSGPHFSRKLPSDMPRWLAIGKYDMLCVTPRNGAQSQLVRLPLPEVARLAQDFAQIRVFSLLKPAPPDDLFTWLQQTSSEETWLALSFLKIPPDSILLSSKSALDVHESTAEIINKAIRGRGIKCLLLGGYGWHELVAVLSGQHLTSLADAVLELDTLSHNNRQLLLKTFTIYALNYGFVRGDPDRQWDQLIEPSARVSMGCYLTCKHGPTSQVYERLKRNFGPRANVRMAFGSVDTLVLAEPAMPPGEFLKTLLKFRSSAYQTGDILNTACFVELTQREAKHDKDSPFKQSFSKNLIEALGATGLTVNIEEAFTEDATVGIDADDIKHHARRLNIALGSSLRNNLLQDAYLDMFPAVHYLAKKPPESMRTAKVVLDYLGVGYQQRFLGTLDTLWNSGNPVPLFYRGGVQRALWALEYLCCSLLERHQVDWTGFAIFGLYRDYFRTHWGIINVPYWDIFDPSKWWGVFHEMGHEYVYQVGSHNKKQWGKLIEGIFNIPEGEWRGQENEFIHFQDVAWEGLADIFDFVYGFHGDWDLYCKLALDHAAQITLARAMDRGAEFQRGSIHPQLPYGSAAREWFGSFVARVATLHWRFRTSSRDEFPISEFQREMVPQFEDAMKRATGTWKRNSEHIVQQVLGLLEEDELHLLVNEKYKIGSLLSTQSGRELIKLIFPNLERDSAVSAPSIPELQSLGNGKPVEVSGEPERIICALARAKHQIGPKEQTLEPQPHVRIATLLSFWNAYATVLPERIKHLANTAALP